MGVSTLALRIPVDPDAPTARQWLRRVLAGSEYQQAKPSLGELILDWIRRRLEELTLPAAPGGPPALLVLVPVALVVVAIVTALVVYGLPRLRRRRADDGELFGADDTRTVAAIRRDAEAAARAGDWSRAVVERFRAISRGLADRTVVSISPGTTAVGVARNAGAVFPGEAAALHDGAEVFDRVRYLGGAATREDYGSLVALDTRLAAARPALAAPGFAVVGSGDGPRDGAAP